MNNVLKIVVLFICNVCHVQAAELLTCTHKSGAVAYTRTPIILEDDFQCKGKEGLKFREITANEKLDPTPNRVELNHGCRSRATLKIESSGYDGEFVAELRSGTSPGSKRITGALIGNGKSSTFSQICPGGYFFAFGPADSDDVSATRYFTVTDDGARYSNPIITVFYARTQSLDDTKRVKKIRKSNL